MSSSTLSSVSVSATPNTSAHDALALIGRLLIAYLFIPAGIGKLLGFAGTAGYISAQGLPLPEVGAVIAVLAELGLGIALLLGYKTRVAAFLLALFTLAAATFFHNFWAVPEAQQMMQQMSFNKNIAIAGGLFAFAAFGAGRFSIDRR